MGKQWIGMVAIGSNKTSRVRNNVMQYNTQHQWLHDISAQMNNYARATATHFWVVTEGLRSTEQIENAWITWIIGCLLATVLFRVSKSYNCASVLQACTDEIKAKLWLSELSKQSKTLCGTSERNLFYPFKPPSNVVRRKTENEAKVRFCWTSTSVLISITKVNSGFSSGEAKTANTALCRVTQFKCAVWDRVIIGLRQWFSTFFGLWTIFSKNPMDHFAMLTPHEQLVETALHIMELSVDHLKFQVVHRWSTWTTLRITDLRSTGPWFFVLWP